MALPDTTVCYYDSTMSGAPALSGTAGTLIAVLDACLVNGFGSKTLDSLVVNSNVATGTVGAGHNLALVGGVGPVIEIAGATPSALNGKWRVASVPGSTTFTFATEGISNQTATGTITAKRAAAGFSKAYSGTNKAAYRADDVASTRLYLRVDDTPAQYPALNGYEAMTGIDSGTGPFPASGSVYFVRSNLADSTARAWCLFADTGVVYLFSNSSGDANWYGALFFGDIVSLKAGDAYHCGLGAAATTGAGGLSSNRFISINSSSFDTQGQSMARSYTQTGAAIAVGKTAHWSQTLLGNSSGFSYPHPLDNALVATPVAIHESLAVQRGWMPGLYAPLHAAGSFAHAATFTDIAQLPGRTLLAQSVQNGAIGGGATRALFDLTGPWR